MSRESGKHETREKPSAWERIDRGHAARFAEDPTRDRDEMRLASWIGDEGLELSTPGRRKHRQLVAAIRDQSPERRINFTL